jgi:hypothetical protein
MSMKKPEWVRLHDTPGIVIGHFTGVYDGEERDLIAVQTLTGVEVWPASAILQATENDAIMHAALQMARIVEVFAAVGFNPSTMHQVLDRAVSMHERMARQDALRTARTQDSQHTAAVRAAALAWKDESAA